MYTPAFFAFWYLLPSVSAGFVGENICALSTNCEDHETGSLVSDDKAKDPSGPLPLRRLRTALLQVAWNDRHLLLL